MNAREPLRSAPLLVSLLATLFVALLGSGTASAADDAPRVSREREALRRTQQALRAAEEQRDALLREKADWLAAKAALDRTLQQSRTDAAAAEARLQIERGRADALQTGLDAAGRTVDEWKKSLQTSDARAADLARQLAQSQTRLDERSRTLAAVNALLEASTAKNAAADDKNRKLYALSRDLIEQVRQRTGTEAIIGIGRVELENWAEDARDQADSARLPSRR